MSRATKFFMASKTSLGSWGVLEGAPRAGRSSKRRNFSMKKLIFAGLTLVVAGTMVWAAAKKAPVMGGGSGVVPAAKEKKPGEAAE